MAKTMMSSSRVGDTLSLRLSTLKSYYSNERHVWDIGCDHGLLGLSFAHTAGVQEIHLVDPSAPVIDTLKLRLKDSYITKPKVFIHHQEGQSVKLAPNSNCIFIAGMGGKEIGEIIKHLLPQLDHTSQIVISPHRKILELRSLLNALPLALNKEEVIWEDKQYYQVLSLVPHREGRKVSLYGEELWAGETGTAYLNHQLTHFGPHRDEASLSYTKFLEGHKALKTSV